MTEERKFQLQIISGMSGAGKSQVTRYLEDMGYYCVDNLPPDLVVKFSEIILQTQGKIQDVALVIDIRGGAFFSSLYDALDTLRQKGIDYNVLFMDASDETLVRRFKETRRPHPLAGDGTELDGIREERKRLGNLRGMADVIIDTSNMSNLELKQRVNRIFGENGGVDLSVTVMSFGYKYNIPIDADLVMDVRFIPNPFYVPELKNLNGLDPAVRDFVLKQSASRKFLRRYVDLLQFLMPLYVTEGKKHLTVAIGCTGGQHRSVALAEKLGESLRAENYRIMVNHRDVHRAEEKQ